MWITRVVWIWSSSQSSLPPPAADRPRGPRRENKLNTSSGLGSFCSANAGIHKFTFSAGIKRVSCSRLAAYQSSDKVEGLRVFDQQHLPSENLGFFFSAFLCFHKISEKQLQPFQQIDHKMSDKKRKFRQFKKKCVRSCSRNRKPINIKSIKKKKITFSKQTIILYGIKFLKGGVHFSLKKSLSVYSNISDKEVIF